MKNWKTWVPLVLAIVLGLVAMKVARDMISKNKSGPAADLGTSVVVLNRDLQAGAELTAEDLAVSKVAGLKPELVFTKAEDLSGRVLATDASKGAPVLNAMLTPKGTGSGLQALIPEGMRAITIEINEFSGVAGNLTTGSRVDVVTTLNDEDGSGEMISRTVVQNVKVQTIGMRRTEGNEGGQVRSVTLLVTPKEAEAIELTASTGRPRLVLRGSNDHDSTGSDGVSFADLRQGGTRRDPFEFASPEFPRPAQPVDSLVPDLTPAPSTQPVPVVSKPAAPRYRERQIKIIRGGVESETTVREYAMPSSTRWMTGAVTDELPANNDN